MKTIVYGNGKTGQALAKMLEKQGKNAIIFDDDVAKSQINKSDLCFDDETTLILSPGVKWNSDVVVLAKKCGAFVTGELNYCSKMLGGKMISVTGTNGKTTVCGLISHVLQRSGTENLLLGNGGVPLASHVFTDKLVVHESSSFQLADCTCFNPYVSVLVSLDVDHLDYHGSVQNYVSAKCNNFAHQSKNHFAVFNADDKNVVEVSERCGCHKLFYGLKNPSADLFLQGDTCYLGGKPVAKSSYFTALCGHNKGNVLCACLVASLFGVSFQNALDYAQSYTFLPHRMQVVERKNGVTFVDDSKGTNVHATLSALQSLGGNVVLVVGGFDKGYGFDALFENLPKNVVFVAATGDTAQKIAQSAQKFQYINLCVCQSLEQAVAKCYDVLKNVGGTLIMSNACSSFDRYSGYAERGEAFCKAVKNLT